jgi:hypothetical protein
MLRSPMWVARRRRPLEPGPSARLLPPTDPGEPCSELSSLPRHSASRRRPYCEPIQPPMDVFDRRTSCTPCSRRLPGTSSFSRDLRPSEKQSNFGETAKGVSQELRQSGSFMAFVVDVVGQPLSRASQWAPVPEHRLRFGKRGPAGDTSCACEARVVFSNGLPWPSAEITPTAKCISQVLIR